MHGLRETKPTGLPPAPDPLHVDGYDMILQVGGRFPPPNVSLPKEVFYARS